MYKRNILIVFLILPCQLLAMTFDEWEESVIPPLLQSAKPLNRNSQRAEARTELLDYTNTSWDIQATQASSNITLQHVEEPSLELKINNIVIPNLSLSKMPLTRVVQMLSDLSLQWDPNQQGINIILLDPDKKDPSVSINLRNISLSKSLNYITQSVGFTYDIEDNTVVLRPAEAEARHLETAFYSVSRATVLRLTGLQWTTKDTQEHRDLNIAKEETSIKNFLERSGVNFQNTSGSNLAFEGTQLIVTQTPRNLRRVENILKRFQATKQVEIEAKFIEVQEGALEELGIRWEVNRKASSAQTKDTLRSLSDAFSPQALAASTDPLIIGNTQPIAINNLPPSMPNAINLASGSSNLASITGVLGEFQVSALLRALEQHGSADLMSAPKLTVLSSKTAKIVVAQELRYPESYGNIASDVGSTNRRSGGSAGVAITAGTPRDFKTRNIGVEMEVTPTVEENNAITLRLEPQVTEFEGFVEYGGSSIAVTENKSVTVNSGFFQPIFSTRQIHTEVTIANGATVVMGGLTREEVKQTRDKVPVLGSIPILGRLFQSKGESTQKRNLLILVTANLVSHDGRAIDPPQEVQVKREPLILSPATLH